MKVHLHPKRSNFFKRIQNESSVNLSIKLRVQLHPLDSVEFKRILFHCWSKAWLGKVLVTRPSTSGSSFKHKVQDSHKIQSTCKTQNLPNPMQSKRWSLIRVWFAGFYHNATFWITSKLLQHCIHAHILPNLLAPAMDSTPRTMLASTSSWISILHSSPIPWAQFTIIQWIPISQIQPWRKCCFLWLLLLTRWLLLHFSSKLQWKKALGWKATTPYPTLNIQICMHD